MAEPDDNATRQRRKRMHAKGDHSICDRARCPDRRRAEDMPLSLPDLDDDDPDLAGGIADMIAKFADAAAFPDDDPRMPITELAWTMGVLVDSEPRNIAVARLLSEILRWLDDHPRQAADGLDGPQSIRYARRAQSLLRLAP